MGCYSELLPPRGMLTRPSTDGWGRCRGRLTDVGRAGLIFHSSGEGPLPQNNVRRTLRHCVEGSDLEWVTPHVLRKTIISVVDHTCSQRRILAQTSAT
jgi:hypothetical protein